MKNKTLLLLALFLGMFSFVVTKQLIAQQPYSMPTSTVVPFYIANARIDTGLQNRAGVVAITTFTTTTLTAAQSGSVVVNSEGTGGANVVLPAPLPGMYFDYVLTAACSSGICAIDTDAATTFLVGGVTMSTFITSSSTQAVCNGTSHIAIKMNGSTQGGGLGSWLRFIAIDTAHWVVFGNLPSSGTVATPCSTTV